MHLTRPDWWIIGLYFGLTLLIGVLLTRRASKSIAEFFLGGRKLPWYLAGISMVATTFAADTPLAVTELVANNGISGNWLWWNMLIGGMLTTFFFAHLWRRSGVLTEVELIEMRYAGKPAAFLRGFRAIYLGLFMNSIIIGWVNLALMSLLEVFFNIPPETSIYYAGGAMLFVTLYSAMAGFMGIAMTDALQFVIAMTGSIILAVIVIGSDQIGGISGLQEQLSGQSWAFDFFPSLSEGAGGSGQMLVIGMGGFLAYIGLQWWASWYPGMEPGGGGYVAQRMLSTKTEKDSVFATLFFQIAHYCLRPWPWILVGLAAIVLYPELGADEKRLGYVYAMRDFLPAGWRGLLLVAFLSAYMSTISTQLNLGASFLVNDVYKRFIQPDANQKLLVFSSRIATLLMMVVAMFVTLQLDTISDAWRFIIECGAGLGLVLILRWYWWRINAWSEITGMLAPFVGYSVARLGFGLEFPDSFFVTVSFTTIAWIAVTLLTPAEPEEKLMAFYRQIRPGGAWKPIRDRLGIAEGTENVAALVVCWLSALGMTYSVLFMTGKLIFGNYGAALNWLVVAAVSLIVLLFAMRSSRLFR